MIVLSMSVESILLIRQMAGTQEEGEDAEHKAHCILYSFATWYSLCVWTFILQMACQSSVTGTVRVLDYVILISLISHFPLLYI